MSSPQCVIKESGYSPELFGYEEILKNIEEAVEKLDSSARSNIAIIGDPFSGRSELLHKISELCQGRESKIFFSRLVGDENFLHIIEKSGDIVLVDDCQLLFSRKIGGFRKLDLFLNIVASSNKLFITTWNQFSWNYLRFLYPLESIFSFRIELPRLGQMELKNLVMSTCEWQMTFVEDKKIRKDQWLVFSELPVDLTLFKRTLRIPVPRLDYSALRSRFPAKIGSSEPENETSVEDRVFQRLKDASEGNPGVAKAIWKRSTPKAEGSITPEDIIKPQYKIDLDYDQAFLLYNILCMECVSVEELTGIIGHNANVNRFIQDLKRTGLISIENELLSIMPEALHSIERYLKSVRLVC
ncbi:Uncharacterised protein [uncultured archaeon]|nr:Uncharacterised protein [uncultured archaeon]